MVRFPKKWERLAPSRPGSVSRRLVSFVDFAPSVMSLAGVPIPDEMQGAAFLGPRTGTPRTYAFAARDFHDNADFDTSRMVRDQRFHYIRNFMPQQGWDAILYSWEQALWSYDDVRASVSLARSCIAPGKDDGRIELPAPAAHPVPSSERLRITREKCLP